MNEFDTLEKVKKLFEDLNLNGQNNTYFFAFKDTSSTGAAVLGGAAGALANGMVNGMEYPYDAVLVNKTENGIAMIFLEMEGLALVYKIEKMHLKNNEYVFIKNENIKEILVKKYALLNSTKKKIIIKTNDKKVYRLFANVNEPMLPYHKENFEKFMNQYK